MNTNLDDFTDHELANELERRKESAGRYLVTVRHDRNIITWFSAPPEDVTIEHRRGGVTINMEFNQVESCRIVPKTPQPAQPPQHSPTQPAS